MSRAKRMGQACTLPAAAMVALVAALYSTEGVAHADDVDEQPPSPAAGDTSPSPGHPTSPAPQQHSSSPHPQESAVADEGDGQVVAVASDDDEPPDEPAPQEDLWVRRRLAFEGHAGVGTPVGLLGLAADYSPSPILGVNLGAGLGGSGIQYALSARARLRQEPQWNQQAAFYLGAGLSTGPYVQPIDLDILVPGPEGTFPSPGKKYRWDMAHWANLEAGVEVRRKSGVTMRAYAGLSLILNHPSSTDVDDYGNGPPVTIQWVWPYVGLAVGHSVEP